MNNSNDLQIFLVAEDKYEKNSASFAEKIQMLKLIQKNCINAVTINPEITEDLIIEQFKINLQLEH